MKTRPPNKTIRASRTEQGRRAEGIARAHLERLGYRILEHNWRSRAGEIDLIALDRATLCIIEVRSRARTDFGHPFETVDARKRARLRRAAAAYLTRRQPPPPVRFDVVAVIGDKVEVRKGAFE